MLQKITLGAGCFWCIEAAFNRVRGVSSAISGYMGGDARLANYRAVCKGDSGHVEVVQLTFDDTLLSTELILDMFLFLHDPTSWDKQGNDEGSQYRSVWFYHTDQQQQLAEQTFWQLNQTAVYANTPIVTQVRAAEEFFPAENYHQGYVNANPNQPYCALLIAPKLRKFSQQFADYLLP